MQRKLIIYILFLVVVVTACEEDTFKVYDDPNGCYFETPYEVRPKKYSNQFDYYYDEATTKNYQYCFKYADDEVMQDTVWTRVALNGVASTRDLAYKVRATEASTAQVDVHYKPLADEYTFRKGRYSDSLQVIVLRDQLPKEGVSLELEIITTPDLPLTIDEQSKVTIEISDRFYKPWYWDGYFEWCLGYYHPLKLTKVMERINSKLVMEWVYTHTMYVFNSAIATDVVNYFEEEPRYDEDGNLVTID